MRVISIIEGALFKQVEGMGVFFRISRAAHLPDGNPDFGSPKPPQPVSLK